MGGTYLCVRYMLSICVHYMLLLHTTSLLKAIESCVQGTDALVVMNGLIPTVTRPLLAMNKTNKS